MLKLGCSIKVEQLHDDPYFSFYREDELFLMKQLSSIIVMFFRGRLFLLFIEEAITINLICTSIVLLI